MKFNKKWVDEWVPNTLTSDELSDLITMAGLEVDTVTPVCGEFDGVVVAEVLKCWNHPDSDHLHVTEVNAGDGNTYQIVCGAPNCRAGLKVALSKVGAHLPGITIKPARLRGVDSQGMLCSYKELGMAEESDGIIELPADAPVGMDLHEYLHLDDRTIDIDLTTNRPDCLGVRGIAREVGVLIRGAFREMEIPSVPVTLEDSVPVEVENPAACPRYICRVVKGVDQSAKSPVWMTERLRRCGVRSVSPIVDVTNYVMLELGQPLHSFDLSAVKEKIVVRNAREGEKLTVLSGEELTLKDNTLIIADAEKALGLAGIFGGLSSGISDKTVDVLFESAFFSPDAIKGRARQYGLATDASHRFERGVDPQLQRLAIERATELLLQIGGGKAGPLVENVTGDKLPSRQRVTLRVPRLEKVLGVAVPYGECFAILERLGMQPERTSESEITAMAPSFRFDIAIEEDLIEEIGRIYGYNNIPNVAPVSTLTMGQMREEEVGERALRSVLVSLGYNEAITYSFTDPKLLTALSAPAPIMLTAPISVEMSAMRTTMTAGLINAALHNLNRQQKRLRLFEMGLVYIQDESAEFGVRQEERLAGILTGDCEDESWAQPARHVDFFDVKGDVEELISRTAKAGKFTFVPTTTAYLHPGQGADLLFEGKKVGCLGMLHPSVQKAVGLKQNVAVFEINLSALAERSVPVYAPISKFPSIRRDFAFVVDKDVSSARVVEAVKEAAGPLLTEVRVFDVFSGESLGDKVSLAVSATLQDVERTLEDADIEAISEKIVAGVCASCNATLRA